MERTRPNPIPFRFALVVVVCILGFMLAIAFNSNRRTLDARPRRAADLRTNDLAGFVSDMEGQRRELRERLMGLRARLTRLERQAADESGAHRDMNDRLEVVRDAAGLSPRVGRGLEILLSDAEGVPANADANDYVIHDFDVSAVVNALFAGGAEAVSVNGERVIATTPIRCAGTTILVNATRVGSPYRILAVGEPERLSEALAADRNAGAVFGEYVERFGLGASMSSRRRVTVPAFKGAIRPAYAQPFEGGGES